MYLLESGNGPARPTQRRKHPRHQIQCRARIVIGARHHAGYLHNISQGGAKLRTITPIRKLGDVLLRLPDLPPLRCRLRWMDSYNAGVSFELELSRTVLAEWVSHRSVLQGRGDSSCCDITELGAAG
jgi:hypothetical protein